ncbi:MAG: phosphate ABC transporter substrate-binding protein PstS [Gemmatimonadota bacterium]|nr:phosphate ABC transporter substrate-binding protein PstS [Gemmatimonadota bacterium]
MFIHPVLRTLAVGLPIALSACGGGQDDTVLLNGAGATFPNIIYQKWITDYNSASPGVELNYQSIGSGGGIQQYTDGTVDFGASDAPMTEAEMAKVDGNVLHIPMVLGAVVPTYNLAEVTETVRFTPEALAGIFLGEITRWDDVRLRSANPGVPLPDKEIVVVHRSDGSGTTYIWTEFLSTVSPDWTAKVGRGKSVNWPVGIGGRGNEGVSATVQQTPGAIGYVELGYAMINNMAVGAVKNRDGYFVTPDLSAVSDAAAGAAAALGPDTDFRISLINAPGERTYPIASFTWLLVRKHYGDDAAKARALVEFIWWALTQGQQSAQALGYAPLPQSIMPLIEAHLLQVSAGSGPVWSGRSGD